jgi:hypothetical protein
MLGGLGYNPNGSLLGNSPGMSNLMWGGSPEKPKKKRVKRKKPKYKLVKVRVN